MSPVARSAAPTGAIDPRPASEPPAGIAQRIGSFRSLGGNCEFGFVQRYCGSEASGLLRFAFTPLGDLIHAISTDFSEYGAPGDLHLQETKNGYYYCASRRYDIWANTRHAIGSIDPAILLDREYGKVAHLRRAMLEDLSTGSKILVRKAADHEDPDAFARLAEAIGRHGPSPLLRVTEGAAGNAPAAVTRVSDRLMEGRVRRFAPLEQAWDVDLEPWIALCDGAYALHNPQLGTPGAAKPVGDAMRLPARLQRHRGRYRAHGLSGFLRPIDAAAFAPDRIYVFSAWIWIDDAFDGSRLYAALGYDRLGWRDADPTLRNRWQRVWAAGRVAPGATPLKLGLGLVGDRNDRFWSCGWRVHEGVIPDPSAVPPSVRVAPWYRRPVTAWLP